MNRTLLNNISAMMIMLLISVVVPLFADDHKDDAMIVCALHNESPYIRVLSQECSDPFCGEMQITFELDRDLFVELCIMTPMGDPVRQLVAETMTPGRYSVDWDGKDDRGKSTSSGVYVYHVKTQKQAVATFASLN